MMDTFAEHEIVLVRKLLTSYREVTGSSGIGRQPRVGDQAAVVNISKPDHRILECVDSDGRTLWLAEFHVEELAPPLDAWNFRVTEVSAGAYRAEGNGPRRMHVESTDTDPDKALADCREFALRYPQ